MRRGNNTDIWIDQDQREDFAVAWLRPVVQLKRVNAVLQRVRKSEQPAFFADNIAHDLALCVVLAAEYLFEPGSVV